MLSEVTFGLNDITRRPVIMDKNIQPSLAANLKYLRHHRGYTQEQLSSFLHLSRTAYCAFESGRRMPHIATLSALSQIYGIPMDLLFEKSRKVFKQELFLIEELRPLSGGGTKNLPDLYLRLTSFSQGCLYEYAQMLLTRENNKFTR